MSDLIFQLPSRHRSSLIWISVFLLVFSAISSIILCWGEPFPPIDIWLLSMFVGTLIILITAWRFTGTRQITISRDKIEFKQGTWQQCLSFQEIAYLMIYKNPTGRVEIIQLWSSGSPKGMTIAGVSDINRLLAAIQSRLPQKTVISQPARHKMVMGWGTLMLYLSVIVGFYILFNKFLALDHLKSIVRSLHIVQIPILAGLWSGPQHPQYGARRAGFWVISTLFSAFVVLSLYLDLAGFGNNPAGFIQKYLYHNQCIAAYDDIEPPIAFMPNSNSLIMTHHQKVQIWPITDWSPLHFARYLQHDKRVQGLLASQDGHTLTTWTDHSLFQWDVSTRRLVQQSLLPSQFIGPFSASSDHRFLALYLAGRGIMVWDTQDWQSVLQLEASSLLAFSPDNPTRAAIAQDTMISLWSLDSATRQFSFSIPQKPQAIVLEPGGSEVAIAVGNEISFWNISNGSPTRSFTTPESTSLNRLAFSPDGRYLAAQDKDMQRSIYVWPMWEQAMPLKFPTSENLYRTQWAFSPDSSMLAIGSGENIMDHHKARGQVELWMLGHKPTLYKTMTIRDMRYDQPSLVFSSDSTLLAVADAFETSIFRVGRATN